MEKYYSVKHKLINHGWLSLVSKKMFPFGLELMAEIQKNFNQDTIHEHANDCVYRAYKSLKDNEALEAKFLEAVNNLDVESLDMDLAT
eukprot:CAMPEP_0194028242 /NCGR_PEP_ID=MMETSP0009_2-20130614/2266_1 /TAXON_ID=210454 /ORGANISM="Grammatophora oceanica, Strain CCMP 410" /LENGTH=87 /DNA_ID=CAMNT_0038667575 /DNA_START=359 /DNA_END=619 /DNA_ORIENTATION=-